MTNDRSRVISRRGAYFTGLHVSRASCTFHMPCDKLQALWSQVKFLKTKEGCAMIQMGDSIAVERCLQNLNNVTIGTDGRLQLGFSKQAFLSDVTNPYILPDKTASFKDFTGSKNNRWVLVLATLRILFCCHFSLSLFFPSWRPFVSAWSFFHSPRYSLTLYIRREDIYIYTLVVGTCLRVFTATVLSSPFNRTFYLAYDKKKRKNSWSNILQFYP